MISACTVTSRAVVGSSAISSAGPAGQRHGDPDPLALAAGELVRVGAHDALRVGKADPLAQLLGGDARPSAGRGLGADATARRSAGRCASPGSSAVRGSWKTMAMRSPRSSAYRRSGQPSSSSPSKRTLPEMVAASGARPTIDSAVSVLPEPDSPITPEASAVGEVEGHLVDDAPPADLDDEAVDLEERHAGSSDACVLAGSTDAA